jgi:uncharacterized protein YdhG (YjbR/CyaY superfamily)
VSEEPVDLRSYAMSIALISDYLKAILSALDDSRLDCEETMQVIREKTLKAQEQVELMREALEVR